METETPSQSQAGPSVANIADDIKSRLNEVLSAQDEKQAAETYKTAGSHIATVCKKSTSDNGILFLTPDQKVLEGVGWSGPEFKTVSPVEIPFYRLDWDVVWPYENLYDGFTSWLAVNLKPGRCKAFQYEDLRKHPAHKGRWDPILWKSDPDRGLGAILATVIGSGKGTNHFRLYGVLKVERKKEENTYPKAFSDDDKGRLLAVAQAVGEWLDALPKESERRFWQIHVRQFAERKAAELTAVLRRARSLEHNLTEAIGFIVEFFRQRLGAEHGLHFFLNEAKGALPASEPKGIAHLMPYWRPAWRRCSSPDSDTEDKAPRSPIPCPRLLRPKAFQADTRTEYGHLKVKDLDSLAELLKREWTTGPFSVRTAERFDLVISLGEGPAESSTSKGSAKGLSLVVCTDQSQASDDRLVLKGKTKLIRLSAGGRKDFGTIIIPLRSESDGSTLIDSAEDDELVATAATLARVLDIFLTAQYDLPSESAATTIYLPTFRPVGPRKVAILFADIRNSTRVTQILRLMRQNDAVQLLMDFHCLLTARVIARWGRRDKFMGDGVMAIFGEDLPDPDPKDEREQEEHQKRMALLAYCCACEMLGVFEQLRDDWLGLGDKRLSPDQLPWRYSGGDAMFNVQQLSRTFNEDILLSLGIGINVGEAYFDYFGDIERREYTCIGDHVNFAARLAHAADRREGQGGQQVAPILASQTVWHLLNSKPGCLSNPKDSPDHVVRQYRWPMRLAAPGLSFDYPVYELSPALLNLANAQAEVGEERELFCKVGDPKASFAQANSGVVVADHRLKDLGL